MTRTEGSKEIRISALATWLALSTLYLYLPVLTATDDAPWLIYGTTLLIVGISGVALMASKGWPRLGIGLLVGMGASVVFDVVVSFVFLWQLARHTA